MENRLLNMLLLGSALMVSDTAMAWETGDAPRPDVTVEHVNSADGGKVYQIAATGTVAAAPAAVWRILADYQHLADFVPDLKSSRVLSRKGSKVVVEQLGIARFLVFTQRIRLVVQVQEQPPERIDISLIEGDMKVYRASWVVSPVAGAAGSRVVYTSTMEPAFYVPEMIGESLIKKDIARMMTAVLARLDRQE